MSSTQIQHRGVVFDIVGNRIDIAIEAESACASCRVKTACGMSETKEKVVSVFSTQPGAFNVGETVNVSIEKSMGMKAVLLAYVVPFVLLLALLLILLNAGLGEVAAGLSAIGVAVLWYVCLAIFRNAINREITFKIHKYNE